MNKMEIGALVAYMKGLKEEDLLGVEAQLKMAPALRAKELKEVQSRALPMRQSAILILLYVEDESIKTLMMKRSAKLHHHAGQISFPGGSIDDGDANSWETAIRETEEEVGIDRKVIEHITSLSDLFIPPSNFNVDVHVGYLHELPNLNPNSDEVAELIKIPITHFLDYQNIDSYSFETGEGKFREAPAYRWNEHLIWGASAMMISEFVELAKKMPAK